MIAKLLSKEKIYDSLELLEELCISKYGMLLEIRKGKEGWWIKMGDRVLVAVPQATLYEAIIEALTKGQKE